MSDGSSIEWLNWPGYRPASWNPVKGCTNVSEGCRRCYARIMAARFSKPGQWGHGLAEMRGGDHRWTGHVELDEAKLLLPLRWRTPRCIFVNSTSDLFHERLPDEAIDRVFAERVPTELPCGPARGGGRALLRVLGNGGWRGMSSAGMTDDEWIEMEMWRMGAKFSRASCIVTGMRSCW